MEIQSMLQSSSKLNVSLSVPGSPRQDRFGAWGSLPVSCAVPRASHRQSKHFLRAFAFLPLDTLFCPHCFGLPLTLFYCIHVVLPLLFADVVLIVLLDFGDVYFCPLPLLLLWCPWHLVVCSLVSCVFHVYFMFVPRLLHVRICLPACPLTVCISLRVVPRCTVLHVQRLRGRWREDLRLPACGARGRRQVHFLPRQEGIP